MKYFSTFSGIGGFELGIQSVIPTPECVGYSEIDKYACQVYQSHFSTHKNYGDISQIDITNLPDFDLLVGSSPCQDLSIAKKDRQGLSGVRSGLFFKYVEILKTKKPRYFILENVNSMSKESKAEISRIVGVEPVMINASLVSAQNRKRLFWCNFPINQPEDRGILLKDILEDNANATYSIYNKKLTTGKSTTLGSNTQCLTAKTGQVVKTGLYLDNESIRKLTPTECARLQCFPDDWCSMVSNSQAYKCYGNAVNVEVVKHIVNCLINGVKQVQTKLFEAK